MNRSSFHVSVSILLSLHILNHHALSFWPVLVATVKNVLPAQVTVFGL